MESPAIFADRPSSQAVYAALLAVLEDLGPYSVEEKKTCLHVVAGNAAFLGVHPRKEGLRVTLAMSRALTGERIAKSEQASANRFHNDLNLKQVSDMDEQFKGWVREAYERVAEKPPTESYQVQ